MNPRKAILALAVFSLLVSGCSALPSAGDVVRRAAGAALDYIVPLAVRSASMGCFGGVTGAVPDQPTSEVIVVGNADRTPRPIATAIHRTPSIEPIVMHRRMLTCEAKPVIPRSHLLRLVLFIPR